MSLLDLYERHLEEGAKPKSLLELYETKLSSAAPPPKGSLLDQVEASRTPRTLLREVFEEYASLHREHQNKALEATREESKGQIIIPTGTGKTRVQVHIHIEDMLTKYEKNERGVYVIGAHRLLLCKQLMDELRDLCLRIKLPVNTLYIGSARQDDKEVYEKYFKEGLDESNFQSTFTTDPEEVLKFYEQTKAAERNLVIVSTYHSFDKLSVIPSIDVCTYDEAHTTVADDFTDNIEIVEPNISRSYFFTATRRVNGEDKGMNDIDRYGPIICGIPPKDMIKAGEILMPKLHLMKLVDDSKTVDDHNEKMLVKTLIEGYTEHEKRLKEDSGYPDEIGAKLLVSAKGSEELHIIQKSLFFKEWCDESDIKFFSFSTKYGSYEDFEEVSSRNAVYESMKNLKDSEKAIICHIDILTEGIDLPSITGVMLLRHLNVIRLMQTLGRALRLLKRDRIKFYKGEISPVDLSKYIKPFAYLLLPMHFESLNATSEEMRAMIKKIIADYGLPTEEFLPIEQFDSLEFEGLDPVTDRDKILKRQKDYPLLHIIEELVMEELEKQLTNNTENVYEILTEMLKAFSSKEVLNA